MAPQIDRKTAQELIVDGRGWTNNDRNSAYDSLTTPQLLARLGRWSPTVRERAAMALSRRSDDVVGFGGRIGREIAGSHRRHRQRQPGRTRQESLTVRF